MHGCLADVSDYPSARRRRTERPLEPPCASCAPRSRRPHPRIPPLRPTPARGQDGAPVTRARDLNAIKRETVAFEFYALILHAYLNLRTANTSERHGQLKNGGKFSTLSTNAYKQLCVLVHMFTLFYFYYLLEHCERSFVFVIRHIICISAYLYEV